MIKNYLSDICQAFGVSEDITAFGGGHVNDTYFTNKDGSTYVLQRINTNVFTDPDQLMSNVFHVTSHIYNKLKKSGEDADRGTLHFLSTKLGAPYFRDGDGDCFRVYKFVDDTVTYDSVSNPQIFYEAARAFGKFQNMLSDFPAETLHETIKQFHDTPNRVKQLEEAVLKNVDGRLDECETEVEYAMSQAQSSGVICEALASGTIPYRVTHNDTKLNNVLMDKKTGKGICVIDLDTVMPGSMLYDFGDALRYGANTAEEDETDLDKVLFDLDLFETYTRGFAFEMKESITAEEKELLALSAKILTYECGIRFLADFINGDTYFKTSYRNHNLDRARNQFKLCREIDLKMAAMNKIVKETF